MFVPSTHCTCSHIRDFSALQSVSGDCSITMEILTVYSEEDHTNKAPPPYSPRDKLQSVSDNDSEESAERNEITVVHFTLTNYLRHPNRFVGTQSVKNSFKGFLDILFSHKKLPWIFPINFLYKFGLLIFYFVNFVYQTTAFAVQGEHLVYYITYIIISLIGLAHGLFEVIYDLYIKIKQWRERQRQRREIAPEDRPNQQAWTTTVIVPVEDLNLSYNEKALDVLKDYILHSLGEFLLLPCVICSLIGFVTERSWKFDNTIASFNFVIFIYTICMDALYGKIYIIWLVQRIIRKSYNKYDDLRDESNDDGAKEWRCLSPLYLIIPFAVMVALLHWLMLAIVGIRIYVGEFAVDKGSSDTEPKPGSYATSPYTWCMVFFSVYLPIASWVVYIILNKYWFLQLYSLINQFSSNEANVIEKMPLSVKVFAFLNDPIAYVAVIFLILPFAAFTVGTYLVEYNSTDFEVEMGIRSAVQVLAPCFMAFFLLANLQATIIFAIVVVVVTIILTVIAIIVAVIAAIIAITLALAATFIVCICLAICATSSDD